MPAQTPCWLAQLQVYMPGRANPDYGIVRTVVKDATDAWFNGDPVQALVYLDTDGQVNNNGSSKPLNNVSSPCPKAPPTLRCILVRSGGIPQHLQSINRSPAGLVCKLEHAAKTGAMLLNCVKVTVLSALWCSPIPTTASGTW